MKQPTYIWVLRFALQLIFFLAVSCNCVLCLSMPCQLRKLYSIEGQDNSEWWLRQNVEGGGRDVQSAAEKRTIIKPTDIQTPCLSEYSAWVNYCFYNRPFHCRTLYMGYDSSSSLENWINRESHDRRTLDRDSNPELLEHEAGVL